ncbi:MAG: DUF2974 domain-containing protein, partial [Eubacterium sp.]|nr:DUF2974 domain-containing protein [Eubacterium sp.]
DVYKEMLPRYKHLIPQSSFIGMMMMHDDDYTVVKSNGLIGPLQHDLRTWQFKDDKLITCKDVSAVGKVTDLVFHDLIRSLSEEQIDAVETAVGEIFEATGQRGLLDVKENLVEAFKGGYFAAKGLDDETKAVLKDTAKSAGKYIKDATQTVRSGGFKSVKERRE